MHPRWYDIYKKIFDEEYKRFISHPAHEKGYRYEDVVQIFRDVLSGNHRALGAIIWNALGMAGIGLTSTHLSDICCHGLDSVPDAREIFTRLVAEYNNSRSPFNPDDYL